MEVTNEAPPAPKKPRNPAIDVKALKIEAKGPPPAAVPGPRGSAWDEMIDDMKPGDSIFVPGRSGQSLAYVRALGKKKGKTLTVRTEKGGARIYCIDPTEKGDDL